MKTIEKLCQCHHEQSEHIPDGRCSGVVEDQGANIGCYCPGFKERTKEWEEERKQANFKKFEREWNSKTPLASLQRFFNKIIGTK